MTAQITTTVQSLVLGAPMALHSHGLTLMGQPVPVGETPVSGPVSMESGRFSVQRNIAIVPLSGLLTPNLYVLERWLGWSTYHGLSATCAELEANEDVAAVALVCNSPGGMVLGVSSAVQAVAALRRSKPVHALVHPLAASAAYWIASQASDITVTPGSWVGSIGALATMAHPVQPSGQSGLQNFVFPSSHARAKRPDPTTNEGQTLIQRELDRFEAEFHQSVATARDIPIDELPKKISVTDDPLDGGAVFDGPDAITRGLADYAASDAEFWQRLFAYYAPKPPRPVRRNGRAAEVAAAMARALI